LAKQDLSSDKLRAQPPYLKFAFANAYNLSLLGGALAASVATLNPLIAVGALGAEALWLLHAPGSRSLQKLIWDKKLRAMCEELDQKELDRKIALLDTKGKSRVTAIVTEKKKIDALASSNPSFAGDLLRDELAKSDILVRSFIDMAVTCARYERYLAGVDLKELAKEREAWQWRQSHAENDAAKDIAGKNMAIIDKRNERIAQIRDYLNVARGQLDLIENTFALIADQIVTMQSPTELSGQLDELMTGVEAVRQASTYTEQLLA
jgi:hypothetical protein